jgi:hypothetical protein
VTFEDSDGLRRHRASFKNETGLANRQLNALTQLLRGSDVQLDKITSLLQIPQNRGWSLERWRFPETGVGCH